MVVWDGAMGHPLTSNEANANNAQVTSRFIVFLRIDPVWFSDAGGSITVRAALENGATATVPAQTKAVGFPAWHSAIAFVAMNRTMRSDCSLLAALLLAVSGCASGLTGPQQNLLQQGRERYEVKDYGRAIDCLSRFLAEVNEGPELSRALYMRGMSNAQAGRRAEAYADLHRCVAIPDDREAVWRAHIVLATLYFEDQRWQPAADSLREAADRMPRAAPRDTILYRLGLCYERTGRWQAARPVYGEIVRSYAHGGYTDVASRRLRLNASCFAIQCGAFREAKNAEMLRATLRNKGLDAYVSEDARGRVRYYTVLVGRYSTYDHARSQLAFVQQTVPDAILWP